MVRRKTARRLTGAETRRMGREEVHDEAVAEPRTSGATDGTKADGVSIFEKMDV